MFGKAFNILLLVAVTTSAEGDNQFPDLDAGSCDEFPREYEAGGLDTGFFAYKRQRYIKDENATVFGLIDYRNKKGDNVYRLYYSDKTTSPETWKELGSDDYNTTHLKKLPITAFANATVFTFDVLKDKFQTGTYKVESSENNDIKSCSFFVYSSNQNDSNWLGNLLKTVDEGFRSFMLNLKLSSVRVFDVVKSWFDY